MCGYIPRECFRAARSPKTLSIAEVETRNAIKGTKDLADAVVGVHGAKEIHPAFQIVPNTNRYWESMLAEPVSDWAFSHIMAELDKRGTNATYSFYRMIRRVDGVGLSGKMFERKVHKFFQSITQPKSFTIWSLDNRSTTFNITFSSETTHDTFSALHGLAGQLVSSAKSSTSCYLVPQSPVFATFDSFLYQHNVSQHDCSSLIGLQITTASKHPISIKGLADVEKCLNRQVPQLKALRPTKATKLIILFVVPESAAGSFVRQGLEGAKKVGDWPMKTTQYILGLPEEEVLKS